MLSGEVFNGQHAQGVSKLTLDPVGSEAGVEEGNISGENFLAKGTRPTGENSSLDYQLYADRTDIFLFGGRELRTTADFELNHNLNVGALQQVSWGFGFRISDDEIEDGSDYFFDPSSRTDRLYSAFIQDNLRFRDNRRRFTFGAKFTTYAAPR